MRLFGKRKPISKAAMQELRKNTASYFNSISVLCYAVGVYGPVVKLSEAPPEINVLHIPNGLWTYAWTTAGKIMILMMLFGVLFRYIAIWSTMGIED